MHTFCAACYSGWMERSSLCPTCRCPVERIRKNHMLNNLVEAYLLQHPGIYKTNYVKACLPWIKCNILTCTCATEKSRSEDDLRSMDARNKITQDMLQPKIERSFSDEEGSSDYLFDLSDNDSDTSDMRLGIQSFMIVFCSLSQVGLFSSSFMAGIHYKTWSEIWRDFFKTRHQTLADFLNVCVENNWW